MQQQDPITNKTKEAQIQFLIQRALKQQNQPMQNNEVTSSRVHLMRAVFIAIDMTQSMNLRDLKPTRLGVTIDMMRKMIKKMRDTTPLCKFMIAKIEDQLCKPLGNFTYVESDLIQQLNVMKVSKQPGFFSLQNTLSVALDYFDQIPNTFNKQLIIVQSSPFTKDYRDLYQTISIFQQSKISINIASLVGWTFAFQKLVEACQGSYVTISSQSQFEQFIARMIKNPAFNEQKVVKKLIKLSLTKRSYAPINCRKICFCHQKQVTQFFVCRACQSVLCQKMPLECAICMATLVFPSDLYRYKN